MCLHIRTEKALNFEYWSDSKKLIFLFWWHSIYILVWCSDASSPTCTIYNNCLIVYTRVSIKVLLCLNGRWSASIANNLIELVYQRDWRSRYYWDIRYIRILFNKAIIVLPLAKRIKFLHRRFWVFVRLWIREEIFAHASAHCLFYDWILIYIVIITFVSLLADCLSLSGSQGLRCCDFFISCNIIFVKLLSLLLLLNLMLCVFPTEVILLDLLCFVFERA